MAQKKPSPQRTVKSSNNRTAKRLSGPASKDTEPGAPFRARPNPNSKQGRGVHRRPEKVLSFEAADDRLYDIFRNHDFAEVSHEQRHQLVKFYQLLMNQQKKENFTRLLRFNDVAIKHFIDCLMVDRLMDLKFPMLDVGTGPGFPGIPLKVIYPKERIVLGEGVRKRVDFLKHVREEMQLENLDIVGRYIDEEFLLPMQTVITRAVASVPDTLKAVSNCLQPGGQMVFMKGPNVDPEIKAAQQELKDLYELESDIPYILPNTSHQRRLVVFKRLDRPEKGADS